MRLRPKISRRPGAITVEGAIVYPVVFLLLFGLIVGGLGVFRYEQTAALAREAARYVSVRGSDFRRETGTASPTQQEIRDRIVLPLAAGLDPRLLTVQIQWIDKATGQMIDWNSSPKRPTSRTRSGETVTNMVRVTVSFQWWPEFLIAGPVDLTSVSEVPMAY